MEHKNLISIIIPAFNAELFITRCLESIIAQSYTFFEVLIIENCSTDKTFNLARTFELLDSRIRVFQNIEKGASKARNLGIDLSNGEYLTFVDADDKIAPDFLSSLIKGAKLNNADISVCSMIGGLEIPTSFFNLNIKEERRNALLFFNGATCCKLYNRAIINKIRYDPILIGEDPLFNLKIISQLPRIQYVKYSGYYYLENVNSISSILDSNTLDKIFYRNHLGFEFIRNQENINIDLYKYWLFDSIQNILICYKRIPKMDKVGFKQKLSVFKTDYILTDSFNFALLQLLCRIPLFNIRNILLNTLMHINSFKIRSHYPFFEIVQFYKNKIRNKMSGIIRIN